MFKNKPKALLAIRIIIKTSNNPELLQINLLKGKNLMECKSSLTFESFFVFVSEVSNSEFVHQF
jgi:hypothetical protein